MTISTLAAFSRRMNVSRSTVSRWAAAGRLVLNGDKVNVEASLALLDETKGHRDDVALRNKLEKEERETLSSTPEAAAELKTSLRLAALEKARNEGRIKAAQADKLEMERDELAGDLIRREDVDFVLNDFGATLRAQLNSRAERIGAELGLTQDQIVFLSEMDEQLMHEIADKLAARGKSAA